MDEIYDKNFHPDMKNIYIHINKNINIHKNSKHE